MNNLTTFYSNNISENNENRYLYFNLGNNKYAVNTLQVVEIMKLPLLDYPQKLPNNVIGLLSYNNFTINILDLRFYLNIKVTPYSISNQLLVVRTDESIFGLIIDKVEDIISLDQSKIEPFEFSAEEKIIEFIYKKENEPISIINLSTLENIVRNGVQSSDIDIPSLFPNDDDSRYKLIQRNQALQEKSNFDLATNIFSQDKFISFSLGGDVYCINFEYVREFLKDVAITPIPCNLDYVAGIIALKGDFVTIINTKNFLGINDSASSRHCETKSAAYDSESPPKQSHSHSQITGLYDESSTESRNNIIILETPDYKIGFLVDEIFDITSIPEDLIKKITHNQNKYILSEVILEDSLYTILDMKTILADERFFIEEG